MLPLTRQQRQVVAVLVLLLLVGGAVRAWRLAESRSSARPAGPTPHGEADIRRIR